MYGQYKKRRVGSKVINRVLWHSQQRTARNTWYVRTFACFLFVFVFLMQPHWTRLEITHLMYFSSFFKACKDSSAAILPKSPKNTNKFDPADDTRMGGIQTHLVEFTAVGRKPTFSKTTAEESISLRYLFFRSSVLEPVLWWPRTQYLYVSYNRWWADHGLNILYVSCNPFRTAVPCWGQKLGIWLVCLQNRTPTNV